MAKKEKQVAHGKRRGMICLRLDLGTWTEKVNYAHSRVFIAKALNHCILNGETIISGYMISEKRVYLVLQNNEENGEVFLNEFRKYLSLEIRNFLSGENASFHFIEAEERLFRTNPLLNHNLVKLLTGEKVELIYHNPEFKKMKEYVLRNPFCSAIDYRGGIGPVLIKVDE